VHEELKSMDEAKAARRLVQQRVFGFFRTNANFPVADIDVLLL